MGLTLHAQQRAHVAVHAARPVQGALALHAQRREHALYAPNAGCAHRLPSAGMPNVGGMRCTASTGCARCVHSNGAQAVHQASAYNASLCSALGVLYKVDNMTMCMNICLK